MGSPETRRELLERARRSSSWGASPSADRAGEQSPVDEWHDVATGVCAAAVTYESLVSELCR